MLRGFLFAILFNNNSEYLFRKVHSIEQQYKFQGVIFLNAPEHYPFSPSPLPYPAASLTPWLNARTIKVHYDGHYNAYIRKLNDTLKSYPSLHNLPLEALILKQSFLPPEIKNDVKINAGGAFNHRLYFNSLIHPSKGQISCSFEKIVCDNFGSTKSLVSNLITASLTVYGSGYAYLVSDMSGKMHIILLKNQETPLEQRLNPLFPIDMWEHAYYLQYQYHKSRYVSNLCKVINWKEIEKNYYS